MRSPETTASEVTTALEEATTAVQHEPTHEETLEQAHGKTLDPKLVKKKLDQKLQLKPPPKYSIDVDSADYAPNSTAVTCADSRFDRCMHVYLEEDYPSAKDYASITRSILRKDGGLSPNGSDIEVKSITINFIDGSPSPNSYCFASKDDLVATLDYLEDAKLLGRIDYSHQKHCYIAVYVY